MGSKNRSRRKPRALTKRLTLTRAEACALVSAALGTGKSMHYVQES